MVTERDESNEDECPDVSLDLATVRQLYCELRRRYRNVLVVCEEALGEETEGAFALFSSVVSGLGLAEMARVIIHESGGLVDEHELP